MSETFDRVDLTNCDREPIHRLGAIQPFGFLLVSSADWLVARASENLEQFIGISYKDVLGRPLSEVIMPQTLHWPRHQAVDASALATSSCICMKIPSGASWPPLLRGSSER